MKIKKFFRSHHYLEDPKLNTILLSTLFTFLIGSPCANAQDRIDLEKIERDFWSPKDTDFAVVQNRAFPKENRFFLNLSGGLLLNDPFIRANIYRFGLGYYWSERWGIEFGYEEYQSLDSSATSYFKANNLFPNYNFLKDYQYASLAFVPFYAKMSFIDRLILYFDMQVNLGFGQKRYESFQRDSTPIDDRTIAWHLDLVQNIFFTKHFALRLDFRNHWANQIFRYSDGSLKGSQERQGLVQDSSILIGVNIFL